MSTHVLHTVPALFTDGDGVIGGAERYVFELARHMADVVPTSLVTFGARDRAEQAGPLRIRVIGDPWHIRHQPSNPFALRLLDEVRHATIIHCHQQHIVASSVSALAGRLLGHRVFCTDLGGGGFDLSAFVSTDRLFTGHLHISGYSRRVFGHEGKTWAHVIWGGVDTAKFSPPHQPVPRTSVLFVGRILPHKGVDTLIRALPHDVRARIVGPAPDARYLADLHRLARDRMVTFHHDFDDAALVGAYREALCVVLPSVYDDMYGQHTDVPELLGQTLLEGMAAGAPGICTDVASLPEIVKHGRTGYVVPPNDPTSLAAAIAKLAASPQQVSEMGAAATADITARFTWPAVVEHCLRLYGVSDRRAS
jgi:glycosyltransferase involved in cell wall biosynthesis